MTIARRLSGLFTLTSKSESLLWGNIFRSFFISVARQVYRVLTTYFIVQGMAVDHRSFVQGLGRGFEVDQSALFILEEGMVAVSQRIRVVLKLNGDGTNKA